MAKTRDELKQKGYITRAIHLALLLMMQVGFTLYGFCLLLVIVAPVWLWAIWVVYQLIGWSFFFWQFQFTFVHNELIALLENEIEVLKDDAPTDKKK